MRIATTLQQHRSYDLTLLMGLDLPRQPPSNVDSNPPTASQIDGRLRQVLDQAAIPYAVVYGMGQARTDCALQAIAYHRARATRQKTSPASASSWQWCCDTCSDAACEHRLFTALVNGRGDSVRP